MRKPFNSRRMLKVSSLIFLLLVLFGCGSETNFQIEGKVPDNSYDGEWIYLVPLVNAPVERVDSTIIKNGAFTFEGYVELPEVYIIRTRPLYRLSLQELLVIKEPGLIHTYMAKNSITGGTALNDSLHHWKQEKQVFDEKLRLIQQSLQNSNEADSLILNQQLDSLKISKINFHYNFALNNKNNVVGQLLLRMMSSSFSDEQKSHFATE
ncbi:DUF4369 domain-containing protein [uncultured Draconibacterium sp.]|uniref:DUF4369 domain-containing protein n=1 Tax=uncultured Draconibacterium sp. TaxID=1573823 RepID=UPI003217A61A